MSTIDKVKDNTLSVLDATMIQGKYAELATALIGNTSIVSILFKCSEIRKSAFGSMAEAISELPNLRDVDLRWNDFLECDVAVVLGNRSVKSVDISWNPYNDAVLLSSAMSYNSSLTVLHLKHISLTVAGLWNITESLRNNRTVVELDLSMNNFGFEGSQHLSQLIIANRTIQILNLRGNYIGYDGAKDIGNALRMNSSIQILNLSLNNIRNSGALDIIHCLKKNRNISDLDISENGIYNKGAKLMFKYMEGIFAVRSLNLLNNFISDHLMYTIESLLERNHRLYDQLFVDEISGLRICLLGKSGSGKTSLLRSLIGEDFTEDYIETTFLDIREFNQSNISWSFWEFAGKGTLLHPIVLSGNKSLYIIVWDARTFDNRKPYLVSIKEWINLLSSSNVSNSMFITVVTHSNLIEHSEREKIIRYTQKIPNLESTYFIDNLTGEGINKLFEDIKIISLNNLSKKDEHENFISNYILYYSTEFNLNYILISTLYEKVHKILEVSEPDFRKSMVHLHNNGKIFWLYKFNPLKDYVFFKPNFITRIMLILADLSSIQDIFTNNDIDTKLKENDLFVDNQLYIGLFSFFRYIGFCFKINENQFVAPSGVSNVLNLESIDLGKNYYIREVEYDSILSAIIFSDFLKLNATKVEHVFRNAVKIRIFNDSAIVFLVDSFTLRIVSYGEYPLGLINLICLQIRTISENYITKKSITLFNVCTNCFGESSKVVRFNSKQVIQFLTEYKIPTMNCSCESRRYVRESLWGIDLLIHALKSNELLNFDVGDITEQLGPYIRFPQTVYPEDRLLRNERLSLNSLEIIDKIEFKILSNQSEPHENDLDTIINDFFILKSTPSTYGGYSSYFNVHYSHPNYMYTNRNFLLRVVSLDSKSDMVDYFAQELKLYSDLPFCNFLVNFFTGRITDTLTALDPSLPHNREAIFLLYDIKEMQLGEFDQNIDFYSFFLQMVNALENLEKAEIFYGSLREDNIFYFPQYEYFNLTGFGHSKELTKGMKLNYADLSDDLPPELIKNNRTKAAPSKVQVYKVATFFNQYDLDNFPLLIPILSSMASKDPKQRPKLSNVMDTLRRDLWFDYKIDSRYTLEEWKERKITELLDENQFKIINHLKLDYLVKCDELGSTSGDQLPEQGKPCLLM